MFDHLVQLWLEDDDLSVDGLLKLLKLSENITVGADHRKIGALRLYINHYNKQKGSQHTIIKTLTKKYGNAKVAEALESWIKCGHRAKYATMLQQEMFEGWKEKKLPAERVFTMLASMKWIS